jgi:hypothetical protein
MPEPQRYTRIKKPFGTRPKGFEFEGLWGQKAAFRN